MRPELHFKTLKAFSDNQKYIYTRKRKSNQKRNRNYKITWTINLFESIIPLVKIHNILPDIKYYNINIDKL